MSYRSKATLFGLPLVSVAIGRGEQGRYRQRVLFGNRSDDATWCLAQSRVGLVAHPDVLEQTTTAGRSDLGTRR